MLSVAIAAAKSPIASSSASCSASVVSGSASSPSSDTAVCSASAAASPPASGISFASGISSASGISFARNGMTFFTLIVLSVIVPVLSTQSTSTRANVSIHFILCTSTFCVARRMTLTANATLASRYSPSGIIPMTAATVEVTLSRIDAPLIKCCWLNSTMPIGRMINPTIFTRRSSDRIISESSVSFIAFASKVS